MIKTANQFWLIFFSTDNLNKISLFITVLRQERVREVCNLLSPASGEGRLPAMIEQPESPERKNALKFRVLEAKTSETSLGSNGEWEKLLT